MPDAPRLRLFRCPVCHAEGYRWRSYRDPLPDEPAPKFKGYSVPIPVRCEAADCGAEMEQVFQGISMDVLPEDFVVDAQTLGRDEPGQVRISSLSELRKIEADSEKRFRNGEGQILNFRDLSQDRGNAQTNSFSGSSYETGKSRKPEKRRTGRTDQLPIEVRPVAPGVH